MTLTSLVSTSGQSLKLLRLPNLKNLVTQTTANVASNVSGKFQIIFQDFRAKISRLSGHSRIQFRAKCKSFPSIRRAVRRAVAAFLGMGVSMPVPGWRHPLQILESMPIISHDLIGAMPMFSMFYFLVWRQIFLQALLLPGPIRRSFCRCEQTC